MSRQMLLCEECGMTWPFKGKEPPACPNCGASNREPRLIELLRQLYPIMGYVIEAGDKSKEILDTGVSGFPCPLCEGEGCERCSALTDVPGLLPRPGAIRRFKEALQAEQLWVERGLRIGEEAITEAERLLDAGVPELPDLAGGSSSVTEIRDHVQGQVGSWLERRPTLELVIEGLEEYRQFVQTFRPEAEPQPEVEPEGHAIEVDTCTWAGCDRPIYLGNLCRRHVKEAGWDVGT